MPIHDTFFFRLVRFGLCLGTALASAAEVPVPETGKPFAVGGEQLVVVPPDGWKLAWMEGQADGRYLVEYLSDGERVASWKTGYLAIERLPYPPAEALQKVAEIKSTVSSVALMQFLQQANQQCGGKHVAMSQSATRFNGVPFAVSGGFCDRYGPVAPFGEGAFVAFAEGKQFFFRIQYGWRPQSVEEQGRNLPWRISPAASRAYLESIKAAVLCGGEGQAGCTHRYLP